MGDGGDVCGLRLVGLRAEQAQLQARECRLRELLASSRVSRFWCVRARVSPRSTARRPSAEDREPVGPERCRVSPLYQKRYRTPSARGGSASGAMDTRPSGLARGGLDSASFSVRLPPLAPVRPPRVVHAHTADMAPGANVAAAFHHRVPRGAITAAAPTPTADRDRKDREQTHEPGHQPCNGPPVHRSSLPTGEARLSSCSHPDGLCAMMDELLTSGRFLACDAGVLQCPNLRRPVIGRGRGGRRPRAAGACTGWRTPESIRGRRSATAARLPPDHPRGTRSMAGPCVSSQWQRRRRA